jgi:hypothetical protein
LRNSLIRDEAKLEETDASVLVGLAGDTTGGLMGLSLCGTRLGKAGLVAVGASNGLMAGAIAFVSDGAIDVFFSVGAAKVVAALGWKGLEKAKDEVEVALAVVVVGA